MFYLIIAGLIALCVVAVMLFNRLKPRDKYDSALKRRAIFSPAQQLTFNRLQQVLPDYYILAQVSFDTLLTTKYNHTRIKYQHMIADFVILDRESQIFAIIEIDDALSLKKLKYQHYQCNLLETAGYKVVRYKGVPKYEQLRSDFLGKLPLAGVASSRSPQFENIMHYRDCVRQY